MSPEPLKTRIKPRECQEAFTTTCHRQFPALGAVKAVSAEVLNDVPFAVEFELHAWAHAHTRCVHPRNFTLHSNFKLAYLDCSVFNKCYILHGLWFFRMPLPDLAPEQVHHPMGLRRADIQDGGDSLGPRVPASVLADI